MKKQVRVPEHPARSQIKNLLRRIRLLEKRLLSSIAAFEKIKCQIVFEETSTFRNFGFGESATAPLSRAEELDRFRESLQMARRLFSDDVALTGRAWLIREDRRELELVQVEKEIDHFKREIHILSEEVLELPVSTLTDIYEKLTFAAAVLMFGDHCDPDRFVFVVEECAEALVAINYVTV